MARAAAAEAKAAAAEGAEACDGFGGETRNHNYFRGPPWGPLPRYDDRGPPRYDDDYDRGPPPRERIYYDERKG